MRGPGRMAEPQSHTHRTEPTGKIFCGYTDIPQTICKLPQNRISIIVAGDLPNIPNREFRQALIAGFSIWQKHANLHYSDDAEVKIIAQACNIDGPHRALAWSELGCNLKTVKQCYDIGEHWTTEPASAPDKIDLITVAAHEIGHALGIPHLDDPNALMYAAYSGPRRGLSPSDIKEIQRRYGPPSPSGDQDMDWLKLLCKIGPVLLQAICAAVGSLSDGPPKAALASLPHMLQALKQLTDESLTEVQALYSKADSTTTRDG